MEGLVVREEMSENENVFIGGEGFVCVWGVDDDGFKILVFERPPLEEEMFCFFVREVRVIAEDVAYGIGFNIFSISPEFEHCRVAEG